MTMMPTPSQELVARVAARYRTTEFTTFKSWLFHDEELAEEFLKDSSFRCAVDYATKRVMELIRNNRSMSAIAAEYGGGAKGIAEVVGRVVGEWVPGKTTIDEELATW